MATTRPAFICSSCARALKASARSAPTTRSLATNAGRHYDDSTHYNERTQVPRWQQTPSAMKMPFRVRRPSGQPEWKVNHNPEVLDKALDNFIGDAVGVQGRDVLPEEVKWLAITHKSFEQGARGFNDRMAFLGRRILEVQVSKALLAQPTSPLPSIDETVGDTVKVGPTKVAAALESVVNISDYAKSTVLHPAQLSRLAASYGLDKAVRWQPRQVEKLQFSGKDGVMSMAVYAIIGAIAMQRGGQVANEVAVKRILQPLGMTGHL